MEPGPLYFEIIAEREDIRRLRDLATRRPSEAVYAERVRLGALAAAAVGDRWGRDAHAILDVLAPLAVDVRLTPLLADMMVLDGSFLVDRDGIVAFDLVFRYVGPLPPYSFVNLRVDWMRWDARPARSRGH